MARISRLDTQLSAQRTGLIMFDALNGYLHSGNPQKEQFLAERNIIPNMSRLVEGARKVVMIAVSDLAVFMAFGGPGCRIGFQRAEHEGLLRQPDAGAGHEAHPAEAPGEWMPDGALNC